MNTVVHSHHFMHGLLGAYLRFEKSLAKQAGILESQTKADFQEMDRIEIAKQTKIEELDKALIAKANWRMISIATQAALAGSNLALGAVSLTKPETRSTGMWMIASGVASVASRALSYAGSFKKISSYLTDSQGMQEKIASRLEMGMQGLTTGLGIMGAISSYRNGTLTDTAAKIKSWVTSPMIAVGSKAVELKETLFHRKANSVGAFITESEASIMQIYYRIHQLGKSTERLLHTMGEVCETVKQAILSLVPKN